MRDVALYIISGLIHFFFFFSDSEDEYDFDNIKTVDPKKSPIK